MLVLGRHRDEKVVLNFDRIIEKIDTDPEGAKEALQRGSVIVVELRGDKTRLGFDFHPLIGVFREEIQIDMDLPQLPNDPCTVCGRLTGGCCTVSIESEAGDEQPLRDPVGR